jgi:hypothetical protein
MTGLRIGYTLKDAGFSVNINRTRLKVEYPEKIWNRFPKKIKKEIIENYIFISTCSIPLLKQDTKIHYKMHSPSLKSFFLTPLLKYIPSVIDKDCFSLIKDFMNLSYTFQDYSTKSSQYQPSLKERSINLFTFGKDSLLSYAISEEIGLKPVPVYVEEPDISYIDGKTQQSMYEKKHKNRLIEEFMEEFGIPVQKIVNSLGYLRYPEFMGSYGIDIGWGSQLTEYALLSLPFNEFYKAKYIIFGNEASCSQTYVSDDGINVTPVFDQSKEWTFEISKILMHLTGSVNSVSLIEPLHDIAIMKILHFRYPHYAKYQMSCFADNNNAKNSRWCHSCSKCARIYAFMMALGIKPETVGFQEDMFDKSKIKLFSLFNEEDSMRMYDSSGLGRDEMLFSFLMAYKKGVGGHAMNMFKKKYLKEALKREEELYKTYFSLHTFDTIPKKFHKKLKRIYEEELTIQKV